MFFFTDGWTSFMNQGCSRMFVIGLLRVTLKLIFNYIYRYIDIHICIYTLTLVD